MQFTREPIIETIITPQEGYKLVVRNSKGTTYEEFFVEAVQVVSIGSGCFYRSLEKPKPFIVPANDYEVVETKEAKMMLKIPTGEKGGIKIGGGRESSMKLPREVKEEDATPAAPTEEVSSEISRGERRKDKRRMRRRRGDRFESEEGEKPSVEMTAEKKVEFSEKTPATLIPPPSTLISETIARYKDIPGFASAFFEKNKEEGSLPNDADGNIRGPETATLLEDEEDS